MIEAIATAVILGIGGWWIRARFLIRPRVRVKLVKGSASSSSGGGDRLTLTWNYRLILTNVTAHDAMELETIHQSSPVVSITAVDTVKALQDVEINGKYSVLEERETVIEGKHDFGGKLNPDAFDDLLLVFRYRNSSGLWFYSWFTWPRNKKVSEFPRCGFCTKMKVYLETRRRRT